MLQEYRKTHAPLDGDFIFRNTEGSPLDLDTWFKETIASAMNRLLMRMQVVTTAAKGTQSDGSRARVFHRLAARRCYLNGGSRRSHAESRAARR
jgi:hypothetical protein